MVKIKKRTVDQSASYLFDRYHQAGSLIVNVTTNRQDNDKLSKKEQIVKKRISVKITTVVITTNFQNNEKPSG